MVEQEVVQVASSLGDVIDRLGSLGRWIQAIGLFVVFWIIVNVANWYFNRKKLKNIESMKEDIARLEKKIDKLSKK